MRNSKMREIKCFIQLSFGRKTANLSFDCFVKKINGYPKALYARKSDINYGTTIIYTNLVVSQYR